MRSRATSIGNDREAFDRGQTAWAEWYRHLAEARRRAWPPYQALGAELAREGAAGLIAPSAARPAGLVLYLFRREPDRPPSGASPIGAPRLIRRPPPPPTGMAT